MAARYSLHDIAAVKGRDIFFDANVLIYNFWPLGQGSSKVFEANYSAALKRLMQQGNTLWVDFNVLSEVINRVLRFEMGGFNGNFKAFRDSEQGRSALEDVHTIILDTILQRFEVVGRVYEKVDILTFLNVEPIDFTDKAIRLICKENNFVLITNDKDFEREDLDLLSCNRKILRSSGS